MAKQPTPKALTKKHMARLERERIQERYLLAGAILIGAVVLGLIVFGVLDQAVFSKMRPVAKVGSDTITTGEFQKQVMFSRYRLIEQLKSFTAEPEMMQFFGSYIQQIQSQLNSPATLGQQVLDQMVEEALVRQEAARRGITVSDEEVSLELEQAFGFYENGTPTPTITPTPLVFSTSTLSPTQLAMFPPTSTPGPTEAAGVTPTADAAAPTAAATDAAGPTEAAGTPAIEGTPAAEVTPTSNATPTITPSPTAYSRELYEQNLEDYTKASGQIQFSESDLREFIRNQILRRKVYEAITAEVPAAAEQIWARHILVATEDEAKQVLARLQAGEAFADVAAEVSTDESNKEQGGDLGWFTRGRMVEEFETAAFQMAVGETSQPVQTQFGYHIIQVIGHEERPLDATQLEEAKSKLYTDWLEKAKTDAPVETYDDRWIDAVPMEPTVPPELQAAGF